MINKSFLAFLSVCVLFGSMFVGCSFCSGGSTATAADSIADSMVAAFDVVHDVAVVYVGGLAAEVYAGEVVCVDVIVRNEGTVAESFEVAAYADPVFLGSKLITNLVPEDEKTLIFIWNTTGVILRNYTISACAGIVSGETDVADNVFVGGAVKVVDAVAVYVDPSSFVFPAPSYGTRFDVAVNFWNVTDLYAFGFSMSWNSSLIRLISHEIKPIWPLGQYSVVADVIDAEAGTYSVVATALGNTTGYNVTDEGEAIVKFVFEVELDPSYPRFFSSSILLEDVKLSDSYGAKIDCYVRGGSYVIRSGRPLIFCTPPIVNCRADGSSVTLRVEIGGAIRVSGFYLHIKYDPTFLDVTDAVFADFLQGPYVKSELRRDDEEGYVHLSVEQEYPANGSGILATIAFKVKSSVVYRWWAGEISTLYSVVRPVDTELNVTSPKGILRQKNGQFLATGTTFTLTSIPGDLNLDGIVDIGDLVALAGHYGCGVGCRFDLNEDGIVDIYDIVVVALNFGKSYTK